MKRLKLKLDSNAAWVRWFSLFTNHRATRLKISPRIIVAPTYNTVGIIIVGVDGTVGGF